MLFGYLHDARNGDRLRAASVEERDASREATTPDNPRGVFDRNGVPVYVSEDA
jgi:hypothetical protein